MLPPPQQLIFLKRHTKKKKKKKAYYPFFSFQMANWWKAKSRNKLAWILKKAFEIFQVRGGEQIIHHLTFRKQFMLSRYRRHIKYLIFLATLLGCRAPLSSLQLGNWQAQCHQEEQPHVPFPCPGCSSHLFFVLAYLLDGWSRGMMTVWGATPSYARITSWWNSSIQTTFILCWCSVEPHGTAVQNSGCLEIAFILVSGNSRKFVPVRIMWFLRLGMDRTGMQPVSHPHCTWGQFCAYPKAGELHVPS